MFEALRCIKKAAQKLPLLEIKQQKEINEAAKAKEKTYREIRELKELLEHNMKKEGEEMRSSITESITLQFVAMETRIAELEVLKKSLLEMAEAPNNNDETLTDEERRHREDSRTDEARNTDEERRNTDRTQKDRRRKDIPSHSDRNQTPQANIPEPDHRRTLILRANRDHSRPLSGQEIINILGNANINYPTGMIEEIIRRKNLLVIKCKTIHTKTMLEEDLRANGRIRETLYISTQRVAMQKSILLGVPTKYSQEKIQDYIIQTYPTNEQETKILRNIPRMNQETQDWLIIMPAPLLQSIINHGGLRVGFAMCKIRPYTQLQRCRRCQAFSHAERNCTAAQACERCGREHPAENCERSHRCINCQEYNEECKGGYDIYHKASSPQCPVYQYFYQEERARLEEQFYGHQIQPPVPDYPLPPMSQVYMQEQLFQHNQMGPSYPPTRGLYQVRPNQY